MSINCGIFKWEFGINYSDFNLFLEFMKSVFSTAKTFLEKDLTKNCYTLIF